MIKLLFHAYGWVDQLRPLPPSIWPHFDLFFLHTGELRMQIRNRWHTLRGPQAVLIFPITPFEGMSVSGACRASVQHYRVTGQIRQLPAPVARLARRRGGAVVFSREQSGLVEADVHRAIALSAMRGTRFTNDLRAALLCVILGELQGSAAGATPFRDSPQSQGSLALKVEDLLRRDFSRCISVIELASMMGMSFGAFRANFRAQTGVSPARFIRELRMREAQRLLRDTDASTKQIARLVGYPELPHLYRTFRAHSGATPAQYRASFKRFG